jgi:hypothetical protein
MDWLLFFVALVVLSVVMGVCVAMLVGSVPAPENRPAPGIIAANEQARLRALETIAARARQGGQ